MASKETSAPQTGPGLKPPVSTPKCPKAPSFGPGAKVVQKPDTKAVKG